LRADGERAAHRGNVAAGRRASRQSRRRQPDADDALMHVDAHEGLGDCRRIDAAGVLRDRRFENEVGRRICRSDSLCRDLAGQLVDRDAETWKRGSGNGLRLKEWCEENGDVVVVLQVTKEGRCVATVGVTSSKSRRSRLVSPTPDAPRTTWMSVVKTESNAMA